MWRFNINRNMNIEDDILKMDFMAYSFFAKKFSLKVFENSEDYKKSELFRKIVIPVSAMYLKESKKIKNYIYGMKTFIGFDILDKEHCDYLVKIENDEIVEYYQKELLFNLKDEIKNIPINTFVGYDGKCEKPSCYYLYDSKTEKKYDYVDNNLLQVNYYWECIYPDHMLLLEKEHNNLDLSGVFMYADKAYGRIYEFNLNCETFGIIN